jgi:hypothetical protein
MKTHENARKGTKTYENADAYADNSFVLIFIALDNAIRSLDRTWLRYGS